MREDEFKQLKEQRMQLITELRSHTDAMQERAKENEGQILAEDEQENDKRVADLISLNKRIEVEQRTQNAVAHNPENVIKFPAEGSAGTFEEFRSEHDTVNDVQRGREVVAKRSAQDAEVRKAIYSWIVKGRDSLDHEEYRVLSKAASGGGYFVPIDLADQVVRALRFLPGGVGTLANTMVTSTGDVFNIPLNLTHGTAAWIAESGSYTPSDETMTQGVLNAYKAGTKIIVSEELLTDSAFDLSGFITSEFGERIGALAEAAYISGDGTGKPTGILNGAVVTRSTLPAGQVTTTTAAALLAAIWTVPAQYRENLSVLVSDSLWVRIATLVDSTGRPLWAPSLASGNPDTIAGIPIYSHPNLAAIGANSESGIVGNFSKGYWIRRVDGVYMQRQNELHSDSGQVGFRAYLRLDGNVVLADALRVIKFAAT
jgi:HK97 family phage major capsid protein